MALSKKNKLMAMFISIHNPLWQRLRILQGKPGKAERLDIQRITQLSHGTLPNWEEGGVISQKSAHETFANTLAAIDALHRAAHTAEARKEAEALHETVQKFRAAYAVSETRVYDAAAILGLSTPDSQRIIDHVIYKQWPLFQCVYYDGKERLRAEGHLKQFGGIYLAWIRRGDRWLQCALRVRYLLDVRRRLILRCKMNVPMLHPEAHEKRHAEQRGYRHPIYEYDGILMVRERRLYWTFEKRAPEPIDMFNFVTCRSGVLDEHNKRLFTGTYLTTDQDTAQSVVSGEVLLRREVTAEQDQHSQEETAIMWRSAVILESGDEVRDVQRRWERANAR